MNIIDSSGWLEVLADGPNRPAFVQAIETGELIVPAITIFEVSKRVRLTQSAADAERVESHMRRFPVVDLTADRARAAAATSIQHQLPMVDSIIYACALEFKATVWTLDEDFDGLPQVRFFSKASRSR